MKKLIALLLAAVMLFAMGVCALADDGDSAFTAADALHTDGEKIVHKGALEAMGM